MVNHLPSDANKLAGVCAFGATSELLKSLMAQVPAAHELVESMGDAKREALIIRIAEMRDTLRAKQMEMRSLRVLFRKVQGAPVHPVWVSGVHHF